MKWIYERSVEGGQALVLDQSEVDTLCSELSPVVKKLQKQYEKYKDIHELGEATERQQDLMFNYKEKLSLFVQFVEESSNQSRKI